MRTREMSARGDRRHPARRCERCGQKTWHRKPLCDAHSLDMPYVRKILAHLRRQNRRKGGR